MEVHGKSVAAKTRKIYKINWHVVDFAPNKMEKKENMACINWGPFGV